MEQPKRPGAPGALGAPGSAPPNAPTKDISDLKARLGLRKPEAGVPMPGPAQQPQQQMPGGRGPAPAPAPGGFPGAQPPRGGMPGGAPQQQMPQQSAPPASADPFSAMRPQQGGMFDLRSIDDGVPVEKVRAGSSKAVIITSFIVGVAAFALGAGMGISSVGRANMNTANRAAKVVKAEVENMQKTLGQIGSAFAESQRRLGAQKKDPLSYDKDLSDALANVKLDPRPDTSKIFRVDYYRLEDVVVDRLFNYYYDSIALYGEVERHVRRTKNDVETLKSFSEKDATRQQNTYGVVFDVEGKVVIAKLALIDGQACKDKSKTICTGDDFIGYKVRMNTSSSASDVPKADKRPEGAVPIKPSPLLEVALSGSTDLVRYESYKQRVATMRTILARLTATHKELAEGVAKAASRPDVFSPF